MVSESDPGDHQRVDLIGFGLGAAPAPSLGGQLGWHLPNVQTGCDSGHPERTTVGAGPFNRHPGRILGLRPVDQLTVTGRGVRNGPILKRRAQVVHQTGRKGILVRVACR